MFKYETVMILAKMWFNYWIEKPEKENTLFNELTIPLEIMNFVYWQLLAYKKIIPIENLDADSKRNMKEEILRIDPQRSQEKGLKMARTFHVFGYLSNI